MQRAKRIVQAQSTPAYTIDNLRNVREIESDKWAIVTEMGIWFSGSVETPDGQRGTARYLNRNINVEFVPERIQLHGALMPYWKESK